MLSSQSTPKEVRYAQYLIYVASIIYLVTETIVLVKANSGVFYVPVVPILVCALGFSVGRSLGYFHTKTRIVVIALAILNLLGVGLTVLQWFGLSSPISGETLPPAYAYVSIILCAVIDVLFLYYLTRPHIREAFRNAHTVQPQSILEEGQDEA